MNTPKRKEITSQQLRYVAASRKRSLHRLFRILLFFLTVLSAYVFHFRDAQRTNDRHSRLTDMAESKRTTMAPSEVLLKKYSLTEEQCMKRFPGLLEGADDMLLVDDGDLESSVVRSVEGRIRGGELWIAPEKEVSVVSWP
jgi:hypothetical protein